MDLFDKFSVVEGRRNQLAAAGTIPFGVRMDRVLSPTEAIINGREVILAGTNNYLGLTFHPECIEAAIEALRAEGTGTTGSRLANGTYALHRDLEQDIATFMKRRGCIVFTTGYQANLGVIPALAGTGDYILIDADSHASIYDGCKLSDATVIRFRHNDADDLDRRLRRLDGDGGNKLIIVEGIYSMLGDRAPLADIARVKREHGACLLVDEAHSLGVLGETGRGLAEEAGVEDDVDVIVGTFSKSLAAIGGFAVSDHPRFDLIRFTSRAYIFSASPSPASVASVRATLRVMVASPHLRTTLAENSKALQGGLSALGFDVASPPSPVVAVKIDERDKAVFLWNRLLDSGVYVNLAIPPGTPNALSLLRCSVSAAHSKAQIDKICEIFETVGHEAGILPAPGGAAPRAAAPRA
ncbi:MAG: aminotransferase class I/II-fold pyridoxal phosphate-dependent enzyme [Alphaproteobacteria bacterium]|nr:aminotransferase class I/II-fold pyridoxal phosphate-dependent enzyme [Alphaproteobacteria bacterium]